VEGSRTAVIDLGTNSTRLLVADLADGGVEELERRTNVTGLGQGVDRSGQLADEAMERVFATVEGYRRVIDDLGADRVVGVATSAVRDAANGDWFRDELRSRYDVEVRTISGDEEAKLTFRGATSARELAGHVLVIDIGGGSTEFVAGTPGEEPGCHVSTRLGSVRQTERHLPDDPPQPDQLAALSEEAAGIVASDVPERVRADVEAGIAVAGTATSLAAIDQRLDPYDPERVDGYRLGLRACERMLGELASLPLPERRQVAGLHPDRAPTIVAGAVILIESMKAFGLEAVETSEADILHGAALAAGGDEWGETG
jgi:exopolyphosphatase / guanosine-5'-triphosphate,3'-diphosphate pyrophosphatase